MKSIFKRFQINKDPEIISLKTTASKKGDVLLSYITFPFLLKKGETLPISHTNFWECFQIAQTFLELGYDVDVINWDNSGFIPEKKYTVFVDIHSNMERLAPLLDNECLKILHITGAHWLFQNQAEYTRLLALQQRRGITLSPQRTVQPSLGIENADCATILGNQFTQDTFSYAQKDIYPIPVSSSVQFPMPDNKDFGKCRNRFLWLGGSGMVHKGLDLVLEVFSQNPDLHLTVCGPVDNEKNFEKAFHKELYQTSNIKTLGWMDLSSNNFRELLNNCVGIIYPSCSEGCATSVITCMHAGLIPIVSYESGVNTNDFGICMDDCSTQSIEHFIKEVSELSIQELKTNSLNAREYARKNHTKEKFTEEYKKAVVSILNKRGIKKDAL
jgi:glycosyltransferase involved in cell wall biosynthesis